MEARNGGTFNSKKHTHYRFFFAYQIQHQQFFGNVRVFKAPFYT